MGGFEWLRLEGRFGSLLIDQLSQWARYWISSPDMWKESNGQIICNLATWISSLCFPESSREPIHRLKCEKSLSFVGKISSFRNLVLKSDFLLFFLLLFMFFFWVLFFCLVFQAFFLLQKKLTGKKHIGNVYQLLSYHPIFPVTPLGPTKNPRPWNLAFTLWASFSQVSQCLVLHCDTMKEMILESVVRWWNRQTPSTLHRVWACSRLRCHKWFPRMFFFLVCLFVFRNGLEETTKTQHFLTHLGILRDFWLPSTPTTRPTNRGGVLLWLGSTSQAIEYPRDGLKEMHCRYLQSHLVGLWRWRRCRGWIWSFSEWRERVYLVEMQQVCSGTVAQKVKISHGFLSPAVV